MKSVNRIGAHSVGLPLVADDVVEFHAARLLLLFKVCGISGRIDGLTKMAKLDFFARYPEFFEAARMATTAETSEIASNNKSDRSVESAMVRHHYGPWDKRYYHVLAHLEAKRLITVTKHRNLYRISLTDDGQRLAKELSARESFAPIVGRMKEVKATFGGKTGSQLKNLIYDVFDAEVGRRPMGEVIRS